MLCVHWILILQRGRVDPPWPNAPFLFKSLQNAGEKSRWRGPFCRVLINNTKSFLKKVTSLKFGLKFVSQRKTLKHQVVTSPREVVLPRWFVDLAEPWVAAGVPVSDSRAWLPAASCPEGTFPAPTAGSAPQHWGVFGSVIVTAASLAPGKFGAAKCILARTVQSPCIVLPRSGCRLRLKN